MEQPENAKPEIAAKIYVSQTSRPVHPFSAFGHQTQADAEQYGKKESSLSFGCDPFEKKKQEIQVEVRVHESGIRKPLRKFEESLRP
jgi:hypothetical protein